MKERKNERKKEKMVEREKFKIEMKKGRFDTYQLLFG